MIYLTIINAFPVKQRMKNAFLENHIFTEYNLPIATTWAFLDGRKGMETFSKPTIYSYPNPNPYLKSLLK